MKRLALLLLYLLAACAMVAPTGCHRSTPPPMPQIPNPVPAPGADPLEVERHQLLEEKRTLEAQYGDNIARIQQLNSRLIQINIELQQHNRR